MTLKKRGRPPGPSTRFAKADSQKLSAAAKAILADGDLKISTALKRLGVFEETDLRRLRRRWNQEAPMFLAAAKPKAGSPPAVDYLSAFAKSQEFAHITAQMDAMIRSPEMLRAHEKITAMAARLAMPNSELARTINRLTAFANSPAMQQMIDAGQRLNRAMDSVPRAIDFTRFAPKTS